MSDSRRVLSQARWCVVAAALLWSTSGLFAKATLFADWPPAERGPLLAFWRTLFAGLALLPFARRPQWNPRLVPMGLVFAAMNLSYLTAMTLTTAANAIWLQGMAPLWVLFVGWLLGERVSRSDVALVACGTFGISLILGCELSGGGAAGVLWGVAGGILYAGVVLFLRTLRGEHPAFLTAFNHLLTAAVLLPYAIHLDRWPNAAQLAVLAAFGAFQMGLPYLLFAKGLRTLSGHEASLIGLIEPCLVPVWVALAWGELPAWWTIAGGGLILVGLTWRYGAAALRRPAVVSG